ncbi:hypothetical protein [Trichocoleus sp. FACHB-90]|nr:hypothetical protein [Trichocoleus sp. FACHB-90]
MAKLISVLPSCAGMLFRRSLLDPLKMTYKHLTFGVPAYPFPWLS